MRSDVEDGNPPYPELGQGVAKHRRRGVITREYGEAVLAAIRSKQRAELRRAGGSMPAPYCASGTAHNTGADIIEAVRSKARARLASYGDQVRRARTPEKWREMYNEAMAEKRAAATQKDKHYGNTQRQPAKRNPAVRSARKLHHCEESC